jgi:hypothetical protein
MIEGESLFIVDESPDGRLESARRQGVSNGHVFLNKFEGAQMEHERRIRMTEAPTQVKREGMTRNKRDYRNKKRRNNSDESRQADLDAECERKAKSRRVAKEKLNNKHIEEREALIEKVNQRYPFILLYIDFFQDP